MQGQRLYHKQVPNCCSPPEHFLDATVVRRHPHSCAVPKGIGDTACPGWVATDPQPAPLTAVVGLGTLGWAGGSSPPTFLLFTRVFVRESRGGLCIVSKRSPALSHANAALKAAPCQTDEIVALFRLLPDGRRGKGPQHPQPGLGDQLCSPKTSGSPHPILGSSWEREQAALGWLR